MYKVLFDSKELQEKILECVSSDGIDKIFNTTMFIHSPEKQLNKQAMIHGMVMAGMMTSMCEPICIKDRSLGHWVLLEDCVNEGVYCSECHKKVYKADYANQKLKSKFCPNCGAKMEEG